MAKKEDERSLNVRQGVAAPAAINPHLKTKIRPDLSTATIIEGLISGNKIYLSKAITLVESTQRNHTQQAQELVEACLPHSGASVRIGITGTPGVGKSTFIEALGLALIKQGRKVAVLAIDPSSQLSKGSILGDKTRMEQLSRQEDAYIRPSPAGDTLGGVARKTRESIILCEAAGYDTILIETVGVGQSEVAVHALSDFFLLLLLPGAGDELQGIKRGIVEMADLIVVNKADGDRVLLAKQARAAYKNALHLFPPKDSQWIPQVLTCSAISGTGLPEILETLFEFIAFTQKNAYFDSNRKLQARYWLYETINDRLRADFFQHPSVREKLSFIEKEVLSGQISSFQGAEKLLELFLSKKKAESDDLSGPQPS
ncbi:MAG TPA: methylmalonyl Co-A mutase-associated GTPase MeaB [Saprospiraceae bacterium]|nr:methylmalonyl Co-A mutase-associated GTPase MeaB [Saprospiraceae bacterium]HMQ81945.1 methylmalonyl Co-A mutase-associated GTPase MeaB [Saprospiraceae bacterium]